MDLNMSRDDISTAETAAAETSMELHMSRNDIHLTMLTNGYKGTPLYHICTPNLFKHSVTTISRIAPSAAQDTRFNSGKKSDIKQIAESRDGLEEFAKVEWHDWKTSKLFYEGSELNVDDFMPRTGFWKADRTFTGPDGHPYTWHCGTHLTVSTPFEPKAEVARFHEPWSFKKKPYVSIAPEAMHMVDLIVLTWVYTAQRQREENTAVAAA